MRRDEALDMIGRPELVTVRRGSLTWTGRVIGLVSEPSLLIERPGGVRVAIALDGMSVEEES